LVSLGLPKRHHNRAVGRAATRRGLAFRNPLVRPKRLLSGCRRENQDLSEKREETDSHTTMANVHLRSSHARRGFDRAPRPRGAPSPPQLPAHAVALPFEAQCTQANSVPADRLARSDIKRMLKFYNGGNKRKRFLATLTLNLLFTRVKQRYA